MLLSLHSVWQDKGAGHWEIILPGLTLNYKDVACSLFWEMIDRFKSKGGRGLVASHSLSLPCIFWPVGYWEGGGGNDGLASDFMQHFKSIQNLQNAVWSQEQEMPLPWALQSGKGQDCFSDFLLLLGSQVPPKYSLKLVGGCPVGGSLLID